MHIPAPKLFSCAILSGTVTGAVTGAVAAVAVAPCLEFFGAEPFYPIPKCSFPFLAVYGKGLLVLEFQPLL